MFFSKAFFTTFTLAAMAITNVVCAPTAQPETSIVEKRNGISDKMSTCYTAVQSKCSDIGKKVDGAGGVVDVDLAVDIQVDISVIVDLVVAVVADIQVDIAAGVSVDDIQGCGNTFILMVNLLVAILVKLGGACQPAAISVLAAIVLQLKVHIQLCSTVLIGGINGLVGLLLSVVLDVLASLKVDISACVTVFVGACGNFA